MSKIHVEVTAEDIDGASTNICTLDPITQAMRRAVGLNKATFATATRFDAFTQPSRMYARGPKGQIQCETPVGVRKRILEWDASGTMEPFEFDAPSAPDKAPHYNFMYPYIRPM